MAQVKGDNTDVAPIAKTPAATLAPTQATANQPPEDTRPSIGASTNEHISEAKDTSPIADDASNYMSSTGKPIESYPYYDKMSIDDISAAKLKGQAQLADLQNRTNPVGKAAQGMVGAINAAAAPLTDAPMFSGGNPRGLGYPGPLSYLEWKDTGNKAAAQVSPTSLLGGGPKPTASAAPSVGLNEDNTVPLFKNGGSSLPDPNKDRPSDLGAKIQAATAQLDKTKNGWSGTLQLLAGLLDAYGVGESAYGGNHRQTQIQKNLDTQREITRQKAAANNQAQATISTYKPLTDQKLREIIQEYKSSGDKEVYVSKLNYLRNVGLIDEQQYITLVNGQTGLRNEGGGSDIETTVLDILKSPGGSGND
jgi:hypothetical protein